MICTVCPPESRLQGLVLWMNWYLSVDGHGRVSFDEEKECNKSHRAA